MQGVEYSTRNLNYFCPTCMTTHPTYPDYGLNVCLSDSQLHNFHLPRDPQVYCPPDLLHVDWLTILYISISKTSVNSWKMYKLSHKNLESRKN